MQNIGSNIWHSLFMPHQPIPQNQRSNNGSNQNGVYDCNKPISRHEYGTFITTTPAPSSVGKEISPSDIREIKSWLCTNS
jgi:hypothetical protein